MLEDIATLTGGKAVTEDLGLKLEKLSLEDLGSVKKVIIDKDNTTIIGGAGKATEIQSRIKQLSHADRGGHLGRRAYLDYATPPTSFARRPVTFLYRSPRWPPRSACEAA